MPTQPHGGSPDGARGARTRRPAPDPSLLASVVDSSDDAIVGLTPGGVVTFWNRGAEVLYGYTAEETLRTPVTRLADPDRAGELSSLLERVRRGERVEHYGTSRRAKGG